MRQLVLDLGKAATASLDNFVVGANAELVAFLRAFAAGESAERLVYVWGAKGSGKSHLAQALAASATAQGWSWAWFSGDAERALLADSDLVLAEDVERLSSAAQTALFDLVNRLEETGGRLFATGAAPPARLALKPELSSRLGQGLVYRLHGLSDEEKRQALIAHASGRGVRVPLEVADWLLAHWRRDLPALLEILDALDRYSLETKRPVTLPLLRELLAQGAGR